MSRYRLFLSPVAPLLAAVALLLPACDTVDNKRTPPAAVWIPFSSYTVWETYGVTGAYTYRYFIPQEKQPANFPYTAIMKTGYGGVLLACDAKGVPVAYDLSCPVENKPDIRVRIEEDERFEAVCPHCNSHYDVFQAYGAPLSGPAAKVGYGLTTYVVMDGGNGNYKVITR